MSSIAPLCAHRSHPLLHLSPVVDYTLPITKCYSYGAMLPPQAVFVLVDGSGSVSEEDFTCMKAFIAKAADAVRAADPGCRVRAYTIENYFSTDSNHLPIARWFSEQLTGAMRVAPAHAWPATYRLRFPAGRCSAESFHRLHRQLATVLACEGITPACGANCCSTCRLNGCCRSCICSTFTGTYCLNSRTSYGTILF